jgi:hypothetical protein
MNQSKILYLSYRQATDHSNYGANNVRRRVYNDVVVEDPEEQTHSGFPTNRTIHVVANDIKPTKGQNEGLKHSKFLKIYCEYR